MNKITEKMVVAQKTSRRELKTVGSNIFYLEKRPQEKGRTTLLYAHNEVLSKEFDVKSKVHEYGGGSYALSSLHVIFVNKKDQQLYIMSNSFKPEKLTDYANCRFADGLIDEKNKCSYWVCETHGANHEVTNTLVKVSHAEGKGYGKKTIVASGEDFYAAPALMDNKLAFISWSHPNMPWDHTSLNLGEFTNEGFKSEVVDKDAWISQPQFDENGKLFYLKEEGEFSNLFTYENSPKVFHQRDREYASPAWNFGNKTYVLYKNKVIASSWKDGVMKLEIIEKGQSKFILEEYAGFGSLHTSHENLIVECYSFDKDNELISFNLEKMTTKILIEAPKLNIEVAKPESVTFKSTDGEAHGFLYLPINRKENLPLMVISHGGPTGMSAPFFDISIQYWVDKGFAVFDVNYRGSTGYGKTYRNALQGKWGIYDVDDCVNAALYCVERGIANKEQLIIRGASAGGYTTMAALTFKDTFKAGASYYGICDLNMLAGSTHKFESRYMDGLIAPFATQPEEYTKRSPVNFMERINCPMIVFQGEEDMVVPKDQAETIYKNLTEKKIPCELHIFPEEGHGFGKEENLLTCMTSELAFYKKIFNI